MNAEIIAVGSELLTPDFQDTNSLFLIRRFDDLGIAVLRRTIVGDRPSEIVPALAAAGKSSDLIVLSGGLGPTGDDLTREAVAESLGRRLVFSPKILAGIEARFVRRGTIMPEANRRQACIVEGAEVLENRQGTAPGQWIEDGGRRLILLPGPPHEFEGVFEDCVWPRLHAWRRGFGVRRILRSTGFTESEVEDRIAGLYPDSGGLRLTVLASPGQIDLHIASFSEQSEGAAAAAADALAADLKARLGDVVYGETPASLENVVARLLAGAGKTVAVAESCSGGLLAHRLTNIPGSSSYFLEGFVAYANAAKTRDLAVPAGLIEIHGAVSAPVAEAMARGGRERSGSDYALGITGIAGPSGGTDAKPVGLVFIALAGPGFAVHTRNLFFGHREAVKFQSSQKALDMLRRTLLEQA
ncbi:MAG: competence/damage-inducible protein A [Candidatus Aminicenantales bacterium]|jgi:nicotinamide-nucleotide amidase